MAETPKTVPTDTDVTAHLAGIENAQRRADAQRLCSLLAEWTGEPPVVWGSSIVGFGAHHYRYASGREGDTFDIGFAARKLALVVYLAGFDDEDAALLERLGPHSTAKVCLNLRRLDDVDHQVLRQLVLRAIDKRPAEVQPGQ